MSEIKPYWQNYIDGAWVDGGGGRIDVLNPATGTHLHIARRYNGEWIPADQNIPFNLSGWVSQGDGVEYDGKLARAQAVVEASGFPTDENKINR